jgi:hypothetical protein
MRNLSVLILCVLRVLYGEISLAEEPGDGGAVISVQVGDGGVTTIDVARGELKVRAGGEETRIGPGERVVGERGKPAKRLLRAPTGLSPANGSTLPTLDFAVRWDAVPRATSYQIVVAEDPALATVVWREDHLATTKVSARVAKAGTYFWRVVAIEGKSQLPGRPSVVHKLVIDTTPPKLKAGQPRWK